MGMVFKKQTTSWRVGGKKVPAGTPGAEKVVIRSGKWYGTLNGRHVPLCRDKQGAKRMLRKLETDAALSGVGLADPYADHRRRPLIEHLEDYAGHLRAKGDTEVHVRQTIGRVRGLFDGCGFKVYADLDAGRAAEWLTALRQPGRTAVSIPDGVKEFTPGQAATVFGVSGPGCGPR